MMFRLAAIVAVSIGWLTCHREACRTLTRYATNQPSSVDLATGAAEPVPRCTAGDPKCGPDPQFEYQCYRPSAKRELLPPGTRREPGPPDSRLECHHDGDCRLNGCGNVCDNYRSPPIATVCIAPTWMDKEALCGCVDGACAFFRIAR